MPLVKESVLFGLRKYPSNALFYFGLAIYWGFINILLALIPIPEGKYEIFSYPIVLFEVVITLIIYLGFIGIA